MFPGAWNDQIETNNTEYYPDPVQRAQGKKVMILDGWMEYTQGRGQYPTSSWPC